MRIGERRAQPRRLARRSLDRRGGGGARRDRQNRIAGAHFTVAVEAAQLEGVAIGQQNRDHEAAGELGQQVDVEGDQRLARHHPRALRDQNLEALALQRDGVDADMHQRLGAAIGAHRHRMAGAMNRGDDAVERRAQGRFNRVDGDAVAQHAAGEDRIVDLLDRHEPAAERRGEDDGGGDGLHGHGKRS